MADSTSVSREQAEGFLQALQPAGEMAFIETPTLCYFKGLVGAVAREIPNKWSDDRHISAAKRLASALRGIAEHLETPNG